jgi:energy-coupling factor transport system ATP-binding protein
VLLAQPHENKPAAMEILARLDLAELSDRHPLSLSGGQKQRVAIAAALASERPIIIFDEPTSGLDMGHMRQVAGLIRDLAAHRRTIVVITHDPEFTLAACDYNISIADGMVTDSYVLDKDGACRLANSLISDTRR